MKQKLIVAYFADRTLGWSTAEGRAIFSGDAEWERVARQAAESKDFISIYEGAVEGIAEIDNPENLRGAFLALAAFPGERIRISTCPDGMMESLGIVMEEINDDEDEGDSEDSLLEYVEPERFSRNEFLRGVVASI